MQSWCAENRTILGQKMQESTQKRSSGTHQCEMKITAENVFPGVTLEIAVNRHAQDCNALAIQPSGANVAVVITARSTLALPAGARRENVQLYPSWDNI